MFMIEIIIGLFFAMPIPNSNHLLIFKHHRAKHHALKNFFTFGVIVESHKHKLT
jgi:hypothetical protein